MSRRPTGAKVVATVACLLAVWAPAPAAYAQREPAPDVRNEKLTDALQALIAWDSSAGVIIESWSADDSVFEDQPAWEQLPQGADTDRFIVAGQQDVSTDESAVVLLGLTVRVPRLVGDTADAAAQAAQESDFAIAVPDGETGNLVTGQSPAPGTVVGVTGDPVGDISVTLGAAATPTPPDGEGQQESAPPGDSGNGFGGGFDSGGGPDYGDVTRTPNIPPQVIIVVVVGVLLLVLLLLVRRGPRRRRQRHPLNAAAAAPLAPRRSRKSSRRPQRVIVVRRRALTPTLTIDDN